MKKNHPFLIMLLISLQSFPQESGRIFIRNFPPEEYKAATQNWNIVQDRPGVMYFSNVEGLLEYDGVTWKLNKLQGLHEIMIGSNGQIYAALENDFGVFIRDGSGNLQYNSLKNRIPEGGGEISTVWQIHSQGEKILFRTNNEIYILENNLIKVIKSETYFSVSASIGDTVYFRQHDKGLYSFRNDSLVLVDSSALFTTGRMTAAIPFGGTDLLIVTRHNGIYIYSPSAKKKV